MRRRTGFGGAALAILVGASAVWGGEHSRFDFSRYQALQIRELMRQHPPHPGLVVTRDVPIRARGSYSGEFRPLPEESRQIIASWSASMNVPEVLRAFKREMKVREEGVEHWLPVQESLATLMQKELRRDEEIELFMIYIGQMDGRHLLLVNAFDHERPHRERR